MKIETSMKLWPIIKKYYKSLLDRYPNNNNYYILRFILLLVKLEIYQSVYRKYKELKILKMIITNIKYALG